MLAWKMRGILKGKPFIPEAKLSIEIRNEYSLVKEERSRDY